MAAGIARLKERDIQAIPTCSAMSVIHPYHGYPRYMISVGKEYARTCGITAALPLFHLTKRLGNANVAKSFDEILNITTTAKLSFSFKVRTCPILGRRESA